MADTVKFTAHYDTSQSAQSPVNGIYGGVTPYGQVAASLYVERWAIPREVNIAIAIDDERRVKSQEETIVDGKDGLIRIVTGTYYMEPKVAEAIGNWLIEKAKEALVARGDEA